MGLVQAFDRSEPMRRRCDHARLWIFAEIPLSQACELISKLFLFLGSDDDKSLISDLCLIVEERKQVRMLFK